MRISAKTASALPRSGARAGDLAANDCDAVELVNGARFRIGVFAVYAAMQPCAAMLLQRGIDFAVVEGALRRRPYTFL
jgi:hypothetical protein